MSQAQPFLIANPKIGVERDLEPWLLPNDAYPDLQDCYLWRGRIKRRLGYSLVGQLNRQVGTTDGIGGFAFILPNFPLNPAISQFQIGTQLYQDPDPNPAHDPVNLLTTGAGNGTLNRTTGLVTIVGGPVATPVFYFPGLPVMGLATLETPTFSNENIENLVAFDTRFSYLFTGTAQVFSDLSFYRGTATIFTWLGNDTNFFWTTNYAGALWTTNNNFGFQPSPLTTTLSGGPPKPQGDGIRWLDQDQSGWVNFLPPINGATATGSGTTFLMGALIILPYKNRLLCFNTVEGTSFLTPKNFHQRVRWSQNGTPFNKFDATGTSTPAPIPTNFNGGADSNNQAWSDDVTGKGGFIDAPTLEMIISAEFVYDSLVVYFERSTWQLRYTGNELLPFIWEKINTELGADSTFSIIPLDHQALAIGNVGIHTCDSVNVQRIDQKVPDEVFNIQNINSGPFRVYGIRDYLNQLLYWTMPYVGPNSEFGFEVDAQPITFPNKILVYNYVDKTFSFYNDSFTCFGYIQQTTGITWSSNILWEDADFQWVDGRTVPEVQQVVGGNQQGFVELLAQKADNDASLIVSNLTFVNNVNSSTITVISPNHNLQVNDYVKFFTISGIKGVDNKIFRVATVSDVNTITFETNSYFISGTYTGSGRMTMVNSFSILTKRFNGFFNEGAQSRLIYADVYVEKDLNGQAEIKLYIDEDNTTAINQVDLPPSQFSTVSSTITAITQANPCVITVSDGTQFSVNDVIYITQANGMIEIDELGLVVSSISGNALTIAGLDSTAFTAYTNGGIVWNLSKNLGNFINLFPESTYFTSTNTPLVNVKLWKRIYFQDISQLFQLQFTLSDAEMRADPMANSDFTLHGLILWIAKAGRIINV